MPNTTPNTTEDQTPPETPQELAHPLFLSDDPAKIAAYINLRKQHADVTTEGTATPPYNFANFVAEMNMTDFADDYQIRAMLESQAHLLATAFNYLMLEGDWKNLKNIIRTQKMMRDTIALMNQYPPLTHWSVPAHKFIQDDGQADAPMD